MTILGHRMADIRLEARALKRLNGIAELGEPLAVDLPSLVDELYNSIAGCSAQLVLSDIEVYPRCHQCGIRLSSQPPGREVESLGDYVHEALSEQNQRLSGWVVHRLVRGEQSEQTDRFIKIVQVSDLSGLAYVLDDELVRFIGDLLRSSER